MEIFSTTFNQISFLFLLIFLGFLLGKGNFIPKNTAAVLSKLENTVFVPALMLGTFMKNFTVKTLGTYVGILLTSSALSLCVMAIAICVAKALTKDAYERNIYTYGLTFSNFAFMGNAVVSAMFPEFFMEYVIFTLPIYILSYVWGVPVLLIADTNKKLSFLDRMKALLNPMFVMMIVGMILGVTGLSFPKFATDAITAMGSCMSPIAMLLTGITVSFIDLKRTFTDYKIYIMSVVRLLVIPFIFLFLSRYIPMEKITFSCALCAVSMPLGINAIVVASAYGKDTSAAAGMAVVSHLLSAVTIPFVFMFV